MHIPNTITTADGNHLHFSHVHAGNVLGLDKRFVRAVHLIHVGRRKVALCYPKMAAMRLFDSWVASAFRAIPPLVVVALLVKANNDRTELPQVVAWFQDSYFAPLTKGQSTFCRAFLN